MKRILLASFLVIQGCLVLRAQSNADSIRIAHNKVVSRVQTGEASYYHSKFLGKPTASGEIYDEQKMTAAHNRLPMDSWIKVTNLRNKRWVIVRVNDRMHHRNKRLVDLSKAAASKLGYLRKGVAKVKVEVLRDYVPPAPAKADL